MVCSSLLSDVQSAWCAKSERVLEGRGDTSNYRFSEPGHEEKCNSPSLRRINKHKSTFDEP
jgi:hypothetical protein